MDNTKLHLQILLLTLTLLSVTQAQYDEMTYEIQDFIQPYQSQDVYNIPEYNINNINKLDNYKISSNFPSTGNSFIQTFITTNGKTIPYSSQTNNGNTNTELYNYYVVPSVQFPSKYQAFPNNRATTNPNRATFNSNFYYPNENPVTDNNYAGSRTQATTDDNYRVPNNRVPNNRVSNNRYPDSSNNYRPQFNNDFNNFARPTNTRNPVVSHIDTTEDVDTRDSFNQNGNNRDTFSQSGNNRDTFSQNGNNRDTFSQNGNNRDTFTQNGNNRETFSQNGNNRATFSQNGNNRDTFSQSGNNRGTPNNNKRVVLNTDFDGQTYVPNFPFVSTQGVKPAPVDVNQPPITNKPLVTRNSFPDGNSDDSSQSDGKDDVPDILIGPDEDDMSDEQKRSYINKAEKMCDSYKGLSVTELVALPLVPSPVPIEINVTNCHRPGTPLVVGGSIASIEEYPHMALIGWRKVGAEGYSWKCGGSLVSNQYVLTAGHCSYQEKDYNAESGPPQAVQLGSSNLDDPKAVVVKISSVIRHPKYKARRSYYDIALLKLAHTVSFSDVIKPACLGVPPDVGKNVIATGWGRTEFGGDNSIELRSVSLPIWDMQECREIWRSSLRLPNGPTPDNQVCAGVKKGGKDTCQGDSGGPIQIQDGCVWRVVAVTSVGRSCGAPGTPALYALVQRAFVAAQVFGEETSRTTERPSVNSRQQFGNNQGFSVTNLKRN